MTSQSGGGGGYPGVTSDGFDGLVVGGNFEVLPPDGINFFLLARIFGATALFDTAPMATANSRVLTVGQTQALPAGGSESYTMLVERTGSTALSDYIDATLGVSDSSTSVQPVFQVSKQGIPTLTIGTRKSLTGALSSVTDPAAFDVLLSIIQTLTGISVATNDTT